MLKIKSLETQKQIPLLAKGTAKWKMADS